MNDKEILKKYQIKPIGYTKNKSALVVNTKNEKYVLKKRIRDKKGLFNYLKSRSYNYFPTIYNIDRNDNYDIFKYYDDYDIPNYEKGIDLTNLISLLHAKTTHYKNIDIDDYKVIYEKIEKDILEKEDYYDALFTKIDDEEYMSPSSYLLIRNMTKIISLTRFCKTELDNWYDLVKDKKKERVSMIHNNIDLSHLIRNENTYLISWDHAKEDLPIYDLYNFYKKNYNDLEFSEILDSYEKRYPLLEEERKLLFILISLPDKLDLNNDEYQNTCKINELLNYIYKTDNIISNYYPNEQEEENNQFN